MSVDLVEAKRVANAIDGIMPAESEGAAYDRVSIRDARKTILALVAEVERLRAIVERLPKTADGVTITPGMDVWRDDSDAPVAVKMYGEHQISYPEPVYWLSGCYSTWEAACHARAVAESARKDKP